MPLLNDVRKYYLYRSFNKRLAMPVWFLFMIDQGLSVQHIALIAGLSTALSFLLEIPSGSISDTIGHKRALILAALGQGLGLALFVGGDFWWILAGSLTYWSFGTLMTGTHEAFFFEKLTELGRKEEYQKLMGRARSVSGFFSAIAVASAGFLYTLNPDIPFIASAAIYWLGAITVWNFTANGNGISVAKQEGFSAWISHFRSAWKTIRSSPQLFWLMIVNALLFGVVVAATEFQQVILHNIGLATTLFGILYMVKRLFSSTMAPFLHRLRPYLNPERTMGVMMITVSLYYLLISLVTNHLLMFFVVLFASGTIVINDILVSDYKNQLIPTGSRATTLSMANFLENIVKLLAIGFIGGITMLISLEHSHFIIGITVLVLGVLLFPKLRAAFQEPTPLSTS